MNTLDAPLEALAFNYLSYGLLTIVNNLWMWVAVVTAAASFWRIKASSEYTRGKKVEVVAEPAQLPEVISASFAEPVQNILSLETAQLFNVGLSSLTYITKGPNVGLGSLTNIEGGTKGKLTLYYCDEKDSEECGGDCYEGIVEGNDENYGDKVGEEWWSKWEMVMKMRKGDDEWYRYQDFTAINGNVVRLWDGGRRRRNEATPLGLAVIGDFAW